MDKHEFFNRPISKRAYEMSDLKTQISSIWHTFEGPAENFFRIVSYLLPFVPGIGWAGFVIEKIAASFGYGFSAFGAALDEFAGWGHGDSLTKNSQTLFINTFMKFINSRMALVSSYEEDGIKKTALIGAGLKMAVSALPRALPIIWKGIMFLLLTFGMSKVGEIYAVATGSKEIGTDLLEGNVPGIGQALESGLLGENETSGTLGLDEISGLVNLVKNPTQLIGR